MQANLLGSKVYEICANELSRYWCFPSLKETSPEPGEFSGDPAQEARGRSKRGFVNLLIIVDKYLHTGVVQKVCALNRLAKDLDGGR